MADVGIAHLAALNALQSPAGDASHSGQLLLSNAACQAGLMQLAVSLRLAHSHEANDWSGRIALRLEMLAVLSGECAILGA